MSNAETVVLAKKNFVKLIRVLLYYLHQPPFLGSEEKQEPVGMSCHIYFHDIEEY